MEMAYQTEKAVFLTANSFGNVSNPFPMLDMNERSSATVFLLRSCGTEGGDGISAPTVATTNSDGLRGLDNGWVDGWINL